MPEVAKIDSNITGLAYAEEAALGFLPGEGGYAGTPAWYQLEPNSYSDFGGEIVTVAPNPINPSRQRKKGVTVDLNAAGSINHNLTFHNLRDVMQGFMFADIREKGTEVVTGVDASGDPDIYEVASTTGFLVGSLIVGKSFTESANNALNVVTAVTTDTSVGVADGQLTTNASPPSAAMIKVVGHVGAAGDIDVDASGDLPTLTSTVLDFTTLGLRPGQWIYIGGDSAGTSFSTAANNGYKRIRSISANEIVIDKSFIAMSTEASTTETIYLFFGDVLVNEQGTSIVRRSYHVERTLGVPDTDNPLEVQSEYLKGAVINEVTFNIPQAELINVDLGFVATDHQTRDAATGPKQSSVTQPLSADVYNTSSDVARLRMGTVSSTNETTDALFAYVTEASIVVNNNVSPNKAIGVLGAFDVSAGTFTVSGNLTAYFASVAAVAAVRNNADVTIDMILAKDNEGMVLDMPLISLGDGRLNVEQDEPITIPLGMDAATGIDVNSNLDHTLMFTFFWYLPTVAM